jgi:WD40 repeat protein
MAGNSALKCRSDGQRRKLPPGLKLRCALSGHEDWIHQIVWSPDGHMLASVSNNTTIRLWNIVTRELVQTLKGHIDYVLDITWWPDGQCLA